MKPMIFYNKLRHKRFLPVEHSFSYSTLFFLFDLDTIKEASSKSLIFKYNRLWSFFINDNDYLDVNGISIKDKILKFILKSGYMDKIEKIYLLTSPGYFKKVFNPVSFYYCYDENRILTMVIAEVNNTFGERHLYILKSDKKDLNILRAVWKKEFHVSPFNRIDGSYNFEFTNIHNSLEVRIDLIKNGQSFFKAELKEEKRLEFTTKNLLKTILKFHIIPHLTKPRIYKEAFKLFFIKRLKYFDKPVTHHPMTIKKAPYSIFQKLFIKIFLKKLSYFKTGNINIHLPDNQIIKSGNLQDKFYGNLYIKDYDFFREIIKQKDIGLGESYMDSFFEADDLTSIIEFFILNTRIKKPSSFIPIYFKYHFKKILKLHNLNSLKGSKKNIRAHYDLSNEFFKKFLDDKMIYSSGIFLNKDDNLYDSQTNKMDSIIEKADITDKDHVLEIGCGWGGFAVYAAKKTGCKITAVTISNEQYEYVKEIIEKENLNDSINLLLCDYREINGSFDKIVSIEMIEAVGHSFIGKFFKKIDKLLKKDGIAVIQGITIPDQEYSLYRFKDDWIKKHIFPGGHLLSISMIAKILNSKTDLIIHDIENIGLHYGKTLNHWFKNFKKNQDEIKKLGFDEIFLRKWQFYLNSCEALFNTRAAFNIQMVITRPYNLKLNTCHEK